MTLVYNVPASVVDLVQKGLLERAFHDGLFPGLMYRNEAMVETWPMGSGETLVMSRAGLLAPSLTPLTPGVDPSPQAVAYEQWTATLGRYGGTIDTHMPTAMLANANLFLRNIHQLGLQAAQTLNRLPRNALFKAYLSGQTCLTAAVSIGDTVIHVAALNGFRDVVAPGTAGNTGPVAINGSNPLVGFLGTGASAGEAVSFVAFSPTSGSDPDGPGTLTLAVAATKAHAARATVTSAAAPTVIRIGGADSVEGITSGSLFTLQSVIDATNAMRTANVFPHEDGFYHAHITPGANGQVFQDTAWRQLFQSRNDSQEYEQGFIGTIGGIKFYLNNESPTNLNSGTLTSTGSSTAQYASDIGAEVVNNTGVKIGRTLVTGRGALYERRMDESQFITEAGVTGKVGEFSVVNQGLAIVTDGIRLIIRSPLDRLQDMVSCTWSCSTSFTCPSDISSNGPQRYKRCVVIEHVA